MGNSNNPGDSYPNGFGQPMQYAAGPIPDGYVLTWDATNKVWVPKAGAGGGTNPQSLLRKENQSTTATSVPSGAFTKLAWPSDAGASAILDLTDPVNPTIKVAGIYTFAATFQVEALNAGKSCYMELDLDATGADPNTFRTADLGVDGGGGAWYDALDLTYYLPVGAVVNAGVLHNVGSAMDFSLGFIAQQVA